MVRSEIRWSFAFCYLVVLSNVINSLPLIQYKHIPKASKFEFDEAESKPIYIAYNDELKINKSEFNDYKSLLAEHGTRFHDWELQRNVLRPGLGITQYTVELTIDGNNFEGRLEFHCTVTPETRNNPLILHVEGLTVKSVATDISNLENAVPANINVRDGRLEIRPARNNLNYVVLVEYSGTLKNDGRGLFRGQSDYLGMNLYPTNARRVFPCVDEPTESSHITIKINGVEYGSLISNTHQVADDPTAFSSLLGAPLRWSLIGHNFNAYNVPVPNVLLSGRPGFSGQENQASIAINSFFNMLNEWTDKPILETIVNQENNMHIIALPDVDVEWNSLSIVGVWEPYIFMENQQFSVKQRQVALVKIAEAIARPWFGFTIIPQNWIYQWIITGLQTYAAFEAIKEFESGDEGIIDFNTVFVTEIIQESLFRDGYSSATILDPDNFLTDEVDIRNHVNNGILKYKAPAIMRLLRLVLDEETDYVQYGAQRLLRRRSIFGLDTVNTFNFNEVIGAVWDGDQFDNIEDFLNPYIKNRGCPLLTVNYQSNLVTVSRSTFNYAGVATGSNFFIPLTFTTSANPDFENVFPSRIYQEPTTIELAVNLDDDDWILFNIQGQGYYRVQYNVDLWERIIAALGDPERRQDIHPLNRATLLDDSLNLARRLVSGLNYDIALRIVMTMELETEYAVWRAYIRNMNFLRKRLEAMVEDDEDLDPNIYLRIVRRTIVSVEGELDFRPDSNVAEPPMNTLTRAMVMDHACRAGYDSCIAAAIDWFYASPDEVNSNIPRDLRPAVYCSVVREGDEDVRDMLFELLVNGQVTRTVYDRVVILESLACSRDENFIREYLAETVSNNSPYSTAEKARIFTAIAESSYSNAKIAFEFVRDNTNNVRDQYGGSAKLEEVIFVLADNIVNNDMAGDYRLWLESNTNTLFDSEEAARMALEIINENMDWSNRHLQNVYEWIDENDSTTAAVSMILLCVTAILTFFN